MIFHKLTINRVILLIYIFAILYFVTALITNDSLKLWASVVVGTTAYCYLIIAYWRKNRLVTYAGDCKVVLENDIVFCNYENGKQFKMAWKDIRRITAIRTINKETNENTETWLRLHSYPWRKVFSVPWRAQNFQTLYDKLSQWERFDDSQIDEIHQAQERKQITLWEKED